VPVGAGPPHPGPLDLSTVDERLDVDESKAIVGQLLPLRGELVPADPGPQVVAVIAGAPHAGPLPLRAVAKGRDRCQAQALA
jgi:hypothetical protein